MSLFTLLAVTFTSPITHWFESNLVPMRLQNAMYLALVPLHFASVAVVSFIFPPEVSQGYTLHPTPRPAEACMDMLHLYCIANQAWGQAL